MSTNETTPAHATPPDTTPAHTTPDTTAADSTPVHATPVAEVPDDDAASRLRLIITVVALLGFAVLVVVMMFDADSADEIVWNRRVYLLGGVQAIVFASVGWLFGREVHRSEAQSAKADAAQAKVKADVAEEQAKKWLQVASEETTKGRAIKAAARGMAAARGPGEAGSRAVGPEPPSRASQTTPTVLMDMVEEFWPD